MGIQMTPSRFAFAFVLAAVFGFASASERQLLQLCDPSTGEECPPPPHKPDYHHEKCHECHECHEYHECPDCYECHEYHDKCHDCHEYHDKCHDCYDCHECHEYHDKCHDCHHDFPPISPGDAHSKSRSGGTAMATSEFGFVTTAETSATVEAITRAEGDAVADSAAGSGSKATAESEFSSAISESDAEAAARSSFFFAATRTNTNDNTDVEAFGPGEARARAGGEPEFFFEPETSAISAAFNQKEDFEVAPNSGSYSTGISFSEASGSRPETTNTFTDSDRQVYANAFEGFGFSGANAGSSSGADADYFSFFEEAEVESP